MKPAQTFSQRFYELLSSMRFAVSLLTVLGIASIIGTVLKQNEPYNNYIIKFGQFWFEFFEKLGLYDVYHAVWFLLILLFLVISTSLCVYRNAPLMLKEWKTYKEHATEKSLRGFSHQAVFGMPVGRMDIGLQADRLKQYLTQTGYTFKTQIQENGDVLLAAKAGTHQRLGYIFTHAAIVIICFGGLLDGNLPFKVQELLGQKKVEVLDIPEGQVPAISRLSASNPSFRANMTLPEGTSDDVAFVRVKDGYLVQELPFRVALKDFRIEHYATGQPKSFESDVEIIDNDLKAPLQATIRVNHPLIYKGVAIYQSDFQDGGSTLNFKVWNFAGNTPEAIDLQGEVFKKGSLTQGNNKLAVEFNEFRKFNIINLSEDGKGKTQNVGPNTTYKLRDSSGQAKEFVVYQQPMKLEGNFYFISGMRETVQDEFKYLRIPADPDLNIEGFMRFRAVMLDKSRYAEIAQRVSEDALTSDTKMQTQFQQGMIELLSSFAKGGYGVIADVIEKAVPDAERGQAAQTYMKMLDSAALQAYNMALEQAGKPPLEIDENLQGFLRDNLNGMNDVFYYGEPYYLQLVDYKHKEASGLQLTKSPGQKWVYLGSALLVLGIFAMFYIRERRIWLLVKANEVILAMASNRKNADFDQEFERTKSQIGQLLA